MRPAVPAALATAVAACLVATVFALVPGGRSEEGAPAELAVTTTERMVHLKRFDSRAQWRSGKAEGVRYTSGGRMAFSKPIRTGSYAGRRYDVARWTSPWVSPGFSFTELIPSWSARTPGDSWIEVRVRGRSAGGALTSFDVLARWAAGDRHVKRHSVSGQADDGTRVNVDTWRTAGLASYRLEVRVHRRTGSAAVPSLDLATVMTSRLPATAGPTSRPGVASGTLLDVPRYSQMAHAGHYPEWGGGGAAWCSPTSTSMVLGYYRRLPRPAAYAWVRSGHTDPWVDHAARMTYDHGYGGTGNWPFNTAYAAELAGKAFVTRLRNLREAERLVRAGIPPVVSIAFERGELTGAPIGSSDGHLLVIVGFRSDGAVVVNDPAARTRAGVTRVYRRAEFERLWLEASGGLTYVIHDAAHPLPAASGNW
ncbi:MULTISPECIES: C39 family peptidase [Nocardioides]|uniref:C39 family peptidase n=1 Tax=Nocardioides vastitatis TaxID=2568655 RepID=A0ABW0ZCX0_9ACTN|nr:C39 family peptidase [Nocardioides sp.]THI98226.1 peptidase C39 family protein [Nocardioides sp.]